ncbi:NTP transferase domain-containing protein [Lysinibacillus sp. GbtcB16]|uniref:NTP transferase domain-containing protein n=1 Tax=Lysinibacillus sp. GbtcB16 TaxID=2824761 RepID=UPI001C3118CA|nr:NTP transferase domain-containing protein [Lysinibacillus sp. GbtcB16]
MNAIILAAGLGSRFKEWTKTKHKALLPINEVPNLERTIQFLNEAKIYDIYIITGHLANQFEYLIEKFPGVKLIYNEMYKEYNSIYSFNLSLPYFGDSFVIDADTVLLENIFLKLKPNQSTYFTINRTRQEKEWCPIIDAHQKVIDIMITDEERPSLSGISYWEQKDSEVIKQFFPKYLKLEKIKNTSLYWDNIPLYLIKILNVTVSRLEQSTVYEMDNQDDYLRIVKSIS